VAKAKKEGLESRQNGISSTFQVLKTKLKIIQ